MLEGRAVRSHCGSDPEPLQGPALSSEATRVFSLLAESHGSSGEGSRGDWMSFLGDGSICQPGSLGTAATRLCGCVMCCHTSVNAVSTSEQQVM